jgi:ankyrin repeat protein
MQNLKDVDGNTMLHLNIAVDTARILIDNGADVNAKNCHGKTPLFYAIINHNIDVVKLIVESGNVDKNADKFTEYRTTPEIETYLLKQGFFRYHKKRYTDK